MTSCPTNDSELQLYRVLQRSNLLSYYDTFICQGGDDVQQLCDAGEEEFLEIMALVGMASKPLHVRRLQKALQEWVSNPAMFQAPLVPTFSSSGDRPATGGLPPNPTSSNGSSSSSSSSGSSTASSTSSSAAAVAAAAAAAVAAVAATSFHGLSAPPSVLPLAPPSSNISINTGLNSSSGFPLNNNTNSSSNSNNIRSGSLGPINEQLDVKSINPVNLSSSSASTSPLNISSMASLAVCQQQQQSSVTLIPTIGSLGVISSSSGTQINQHHHLHHQQQQQSTIHPSSHHHVTSSSSSSSASSGSSSLSVSLSIHPKSSSTPNGSMGITALSNHSSSHSGPPSPSSKDNSVTITSNGNSIQCPSSNHNNNNTTIISSQNQSGLITNEYGQPASPISLTPVLVDNQIIRLAEAAENLVKSLPPMDPKLASNKKRISKELEVVINMSEDDPKRMDEIRKYAAIYGRFDCKRKPEKPLTLHEVSVNEAAAQICKHIPALLTRRDELFPLARQVVRNSGYQYSKGHSRSQFYPKILDGSGYGGNMDSIIESNGSTSSGKRRRLSENDSVYEAKIQCTEEEKSRRQGRLENIIDQLKTLGCRQKELKSQLQQSRDLSHLNDVQSELEHISIQQMQLINEQSELNKQLKKLDKFQSGMNRQLNRSLSDEKGDTDDTDSQFSVYSNELSPCMSQPGQPDESPVHESSQNSDHFNRILPANKTGNHLISTQLTRQLVHETLLDEGLRLVKEFTDVANKDCDLTNRIKETISNTNHPHLHLNLDPKDSNDNNNNNNNNHCNINNHNHNSNDEIINHCPNSNGSSNDNGIDLRVKQIENGSSTQLQPTNWTHN